MVREAMVADYRTTPPGLVDSVETPEPLYEILAMVRIMTDFGSLDLPDADGRAVADRVGTEARALLDG